jgi:hypothetical protein
MYFNLWFVAKITKCRKVVCLIYNTFEGIRKKAIATQFEVLYQHLHEGTEEKPQ